jgi:OmpA family
MKKILALIAATALTLTAFTAPASAAKPAMELKGRVYFADSSSVLTKTAKQALRKIYNGVADAQRLRVVGFVQTGNGEVNNSSLSASRAKAVKKHLKRLGFEGRISTAGKGLAPTKPGNAESRRASVWAPVESEAQRTSSLRFTNVYFSSCEQDAVSGPITAEFKNGSTVVGTFTFNCELGDPKSVTWEELPAGNFQVEIYYESYWYCEDKWVSDPWTLGECGGENKLMATIYAQISLEENQVTEIAIPIVPID